MKYDEMERVEVESYPKNNVVIERGNVAKKKGSSRGKGLSFAVGASIMGAGVAIVTLGTTLVSMAVNGVLSDVFKALIG